MGEKPEGENLKKADDKNKDAAMKKMDDGGAGKSERVEGPDEPPEPAESANLNLSKSNMARGGGFPEAAEATNLNSSKSNTARGGVAAPPQDPAAATNLNTSRSN